MIVAAGSYPTVGFHFQVKFNGLSEKDIGFQSVSGLDVQIESKEVKEGGEGRFVHKVPEKSKFSSTATLKRALVGPKDSALTDWCMDAFLHLKFKPLSVVNIELLDEEHNKLVTWNLHHVWPKSWKVAELNAERSEVLIETLELHYNRFSYEKS